MLTAIVLAKNEAEKIKSCIESLDFADEIIVGDDESTDNTAEIAKKLHANVIKVPHFESFSDKRNFLLSNSKTQWTLFVDADETVPTKLANEILNEIKDNTVNGFYITRIDELWGKIHKYGDNTVSLLRLGRTNCGIWKGRVHETWEIKGETKRLSYWLIHKPHQKYIEFLNEINHYSTLRAQELHMQHKKTNVTKIVMYPIGKFMYLYFFKLGFIDGVTGFITSMTMAFYSFLTKGKLWLLQNGRQA